LKSLRKNELHHFQWSESLLTCIYRWNQKYTELEAYNLASAIMEKARNWRLMLSTEEVKNAIMGNAHDINIVLLVVGMVSKAHSSAPEKNRGG
jgi:hypothetical protein